MGRTANPFYQKHMDQINKKIQLARDEADTPFDQIYHKERKLVQDIIFIEKQIMDIEAKLPNPAGSAQYDPKQMDEHPIYGDLYSN